MTNVEKVAILGGQRIPFARRNTAYRHKSNQDMLTETLRALTEKFSLQGQRLGEVVGGAVLKRTSDFNLTRESLLGCGLSYETPAYELQQACATSLQAAVVVSDKIALGRIEVGIACGTDSTSDLPLELSNDLRRIVLDASAAQSLSKQLEAWSRFRPSMFKPSAGSVDEPRTGLSMGKHCELMVKEWHITREAQDELALASHSNGVAAYQRGFYKNLVTPFGGLERDNNLRADTSIERLAKLKPSFDTTWGSGTLTAGNSTPLTDGASSLLLSNHSWAQRHGHEPLAWLVDSETAAVDFFSRDAEGLLMAPAHAVARLLARNNLALCDFDFYEIHEAFCGQVLCTLKAWESADYCQKRLKLDKPLGSIDSSSMNLNGGSVGLGHPFAATGARILASAAKQLAELRANEGKKGRTLISVCASGGLGVAAILEG